MIAFTLVVYRSIRIDGTDLEELFTVLFVLIVLKKHNEVIESIVAEPCPMTAFSR